MQAFAGNQPGGKFKKFLADGGHVVCSFATSAGQFEFLTFCVTKQKIQTERTTLSSMLLCPLDLFFYVLVLTRGLRSGRVTAVEKCAPTTVGAFSFMARAPCSRRFCSAGSLAGVFPFGPFLCSLGRRPRLATHKNDPRRLKPRQFCAGYDPVRHD